MLAISASQTRAAEPEGTSSYQATPYTCRTRESYSTSHKSSRLSYPAKAELGALYIMARKAIYIRIILAKLGHKQVRAPIQIDISTAKEIINNKVQPKRIKAMDMRFHWLRDRELQVQLRFYWRHLCFQRPGTSVLWK